MKDLTILASAAGDPSMPGLVKCFKNNGERNIRIIGADMTDDPTVSFMVDKFYHVPAATASGYCDCMLNISRQEKVDIYFPFISAEVNAVSARKQDFKNIGTILSAPDENAAAIANNKLKTYEFLSSKGIPTPKFYAVHSVQDFIDGCKALDYPKNPVCLKVAEGSGSRGVRIIDAQRNRYRIFTEEKPNSFFTSYQDMLNVLREADIFREMMLVEYLPGNEYTVDLLADCGKVLYEVGRENPVSLMSIAQESIVARIDSAYEISEAVVKEMNLDGNIGIDFMKAADGVPMLTDINPRLTATVSVIAAAGINLPYLRVKQLLGEELPTLKVNYGVRLKRRYYELFCDRAGNLVDI